MVTEKEFEIKNGTLIRYNGDKEEVVVPNEVTHIERYAFRNCRTLRHITIPGSVMKVEPLGFPNLESVTIEEGVVFIEDNAFARCNFKEITIPGSVKSIGKWAFSSCEKLENIFVSEKSHFFASVEGVLFSKEKKELLMYPNGKKEKSYTIPNDVKVIKEFAFSKCKNLKFINLPQGLKSIRENAFYECSNLKKIVLPDSLTDIGMAAFEFCESLKSICIPGAVDSIDSETFDFCSNLKTVKITGCGTDVENAFCGCNSLEKIIVPKKSAFVKSIEGVLLDDTRLILYPPAKKDKKYVIPDCVRTIASTAFCGCLNLECVVVPESVTQLGYLSFTGNDNLKDIYFLNKHCHLHNKMWFNNKTKIHGFKDSTAEIYAEENNLQFEEINEFSDE